jgi:aryl-alcohol dehydrogenase-like predicted oxidoreductase
MTGAGGMPTLRNQMSQNMALVERMREIANRHKRSVGEVAIAWTLRHPVVTGAIVGARNTRQADGVVRARELHFNEIEAFAETAA